MLLWQQFYTSFWGFNPPLLSSVVVCRVELVGYSGWMYV